MSRRDVERVTAVTGGGAATDVVVVGWDPDVTGNMAVVAWNAGVVATVGALQNFVSIISGSGALPNPPANFFPVTQYVSPATGLMGTASMTGYTRATVYVTYQPELAGTDNQLVVGFLWSFDNGTTYFAETAVFDPVSGTATVDMQAGPTLVYCVKTTANADEQTYAFALTCPADATDLRVLCFDSASAPTGQVINVSVGRATI